MIVFCEECGEKHVINPDDLKGGDPNQFKCRVCGDFLRVYDPPAMATQQRSSQTGLVLRIGNDVVEINKTKPIVTLGRQSSNDISIKDNCVSRSHARVEYRRNKFVLIDQSTNGTYVLFEGKHGFNLRRDELPLSGSGIIGLGRRVDQSSPEAIHFTIKA